MHIEKERERLYQISQNLMSLRKKQSSRSHWILPRLTTALCYTRNKIERKPTSYLLLMYFHEHISSQFIFHGTQVLSAVSSLLYPPINYTVNHHLVMGTLFFMQISLSTLLWGLSLMAIFFSFLSHIWI